MRISSAHMFRQGVDAMLQRQRDLAETELQVAEGKRILKPSDDPASAVRVLDLQEAQRRIDQYQRNADSADARLNLEETALDTIGNLMQRVRELAVRGNNGSLSNDDRQAIAEEVLQHLDSYMQLVNTKAPNGEYIFSGFKTQTQPFTHDGAGTFTYHGDQGQRVVKVGDTREIATGDPGTIFTNIDAAAGGTTDLGAIIYDLAANLNAGTGSATALTDLDTALGRILTTRASIGARVNAVDEQKTANDAFKIAVTEVKSSLEDLDYAEAISRFNQQLTALQASQQSFIKVQDLNLFNFLR